MACRSRSSVAGGLALALLFAAPAFAADLPPIKASPSNAVPQCATPGRLMAYLEERNAQLAPKYGNIAAEYMRTGEALGLRWDYAFFQMLLETGYLTYKGDVKPEQNNFAGLGATGNGARGESFKDVATGVRAHLEHLVMYSGERVENPVAERTRNVQDWGLLVSWHKSFSRPVTFADLAAKWAPGSRSYARDMDTIAERFMSGACLGPDPKPELVADARGGTAGDAAPAAKAAAAASPPPIKKEDSPRRPMDQVKQEGEANLPPGAGAYAAPVAPATVPAQGAVVEAKASSPEVKIINSEPEMPKASVNSPASSPPKADPGKASAEKSPSEQKKDDSGAQVAALDAAAKASQKAEKKESEKKALEKKEPEKKAAEKKPAPSSCRVFTASYGGTKAIIIKAVADKTVNYTVLDVNEGDEKREADAYIEAYAKGGVKVAEFPSQTKALERAFELCPEG